MWLAAACDELPPPDETIPPAPPFDERGIYRQLNKKSHGASSFSAAEYEKLSILVIFACNKYKHERLPNLRCAVSDGKLIVRTFTPFGFRVFVELYDEQVTKASIDDALNRLMEEYSLVDDDGNVVNRVGRLYIVFAGHGVPDATTRDGTSFFCPHDFDPTRCAPSACANRTPSPTRVSLAGVTRQDTSSLS